jgi:hypothetical protein
LEQLRKQQQQQHRQIVEFGAVLQYKYTGRLSLEKTGWRKSDMGGGFLPVN